MTEQTEHEKKYGHTVEECLGHFDWEEKLDENEE